MTDLFTGAVVWVDLGDSLGREQRGRRPAVVVSSRAHLAASVELVTVLPCTSKYRGWPNHVELRGETALGRPMYAMTEQIRTISRTRVHPTSGFVAIECLRHIARWVSAWHVT
ncbi:MAG: type II toxin-antitoxin system PemK/MazF family toxin [Actinomycetales bacterium]|nr:type II toxin-antitoxin system PemK/MazF family toxin [Actinomycetales bacterium]